MKYQPPSAQAEESARQRLIAELQNKVERQTAEIQELEKEKQQLRQEKDELIQTLFLSKKPKCTVRTSFNPLDKSTLYRMLI